MLSLIIAWAILAIPTLSIGLRLVGRACPDPNLNETDRWLTAAWTGLPLLANICLAASILVPVNGVTGAVIFFAVALLFPRRQSANIPRWIVLSAILIATFSSQPSIWYDTGLYHQQAVQWLAEFGAVKGVALLHNRLGFVSSWFALAAPFDATVSPAAAGNVINGFVLVLAVIHMIVAMSRIVSQSARRSDVFAAIILLFCVSYGVFGQRMAISLSPDFPAGVLTSISAWMIIKKREGGFTEAQFFRTLVPVSASLIAIKPTCLPVVAVVALLLLIDRRLSAWAKGRFLVLMFLMVLPLISASFIATGCPLYPSPVLCSESVPWAIGESKTHEDMNIIKNFARNGGSGTNEDPKWLLKWWWLPSTGSIKPDFLILIASIAAGGWVIYTGLKRNSIKDLGILILAGLGILLIMAGAPSLRFGFGYFFVLPAFLISRRFNDAFPLAILLPLGIILLTPYEDLHLRKLRIGMAVLVAGVYFAGLAFRRSGIASKAHLIVASSGLLIILSAFYPIRPHWLAPGPYASIETTIKKAGDFKYNSPVAGNLCGAAPLPCSPELRVSMIFQCDQREGFAGGLCQTSTAPAK